MYNKIQRMAQKYTLNIDEFDNIIKKFVEENGYYKYEADVQNDKIIYRFFESEGDTRFSSVLSCYISSGRVSFYESGKKPEIAANCKEKLISETELKVAENKTFTVKPVEQNDFEEVIEFLKSQSECEKEIIQPLDKNIHSSVRIIGKYGDSIRFNFYHTGTLLAQGRPGPTFTNFIEIALELFNPAEIQKEHLKFFDLSNQDEIVNSNLEEHLPDAVGKIDDKLQAIISPSLALLNNPLELTDFSAYAFPVLRGAEGVLKSMFVRDGIEIHDFGEFFKLNNSTHRYQWNPDKKVSELFPDKNLRDNLLSLYNFYNFERHSIFHVDTTITTTRTLDYSYAIDIIKEGLKLINKVYKYS